MSTSYFAHFFMRKRFNASRSFIICRTYTLTIRDLELKYTIYTDIQLEWVFFLTSQIYKWEAIFINLILLHQIYRLNSPSIKFAQVTIQGKGCVCKNSVLKSIGRGPSGENGGSVPNPSSRSVRQLLLMLVRQFLVHGVLPSNYHKKNIHNI